MSELFKDIFAFLIIGAFILLFIVVIIATWPVVTIVFGVILSVTGLIFGLPWALDRLFDKFS